MKYQITSDNIELSSSMETLAKEKFSRIENRLKDIDEDTKSARIVLNSAPNGMFTVKAKIVAQGHEYFSDETDYTLEGALIKTVEEITQMIEKGKRQEDKKATRSHKVMEQEIELQEMDYEEQ